ncbi:ligand-binding sensor domain-containing protein [Marinigracilibium pacificum]|uniref:histidine kinase n=1 Tax=Marinigracilibium pacificum TaxID=2729599 RepID=A0A848IVS2_9BACT|nr:two-component regulator propeller domain-containing protein [Marinigracilibium pacificum]NMM47341.1 hypothetical protein [Marinigracilibium pacificum]
MRVFLLIFFLIPNLIFAQISFDHITVDQGLSQSGVNDFDQDKQGYLWIATRDGLNKYDGQNFEIFRNKRSDSTSIGNNNIWSLEIDDQDNIWLGTIAGLSCFDAERSRFYNYTNPEYQYKFPNTSDITFNGDSVIIGTHEGVFIFLRSSKRWISIDSFQNVRINAIEKLSNGQILIASEIGAYIFENAGVKQVLGDVISDVRDIFVYEEGVLLGDETRIFKFNQNLTLTDEIEIYSDDKFSLMDIICDGSGNFWVAYKGVRIIDKDFSNVKVYSHDEIDPKSLNSNFTSTIYKTRDGSIWVGTNGAGINKYDPNSLKFNTVTHNPFDNRFLSSGYVSGFYHDKYLYVGLVDEIDVFDISTYPAKKIKTIDFKDVRPERIYKIIPFDNKFLIGSEHTLLVMDGDQYEPVTVGFSINDIQQISDHHYLIISSDSVNRIKIYNTKLNEIKDVVHDDIKELLYSALVETDQIWVGGGRGLYKFSKDLESYEYYSGENGEFTFQVKCITRDKEGKLWIGTWGEGLYIFDETKNTLIPFKLNNELPNSTIYGILEDDAGNLWFSSNNGLMCYFKEDQSIKHYTYEDGLQSNEFNTASYLKLNDGTLVFGGIKGFSYFHPQSIASQNQNQIQFVEEIQINEIPIDYHDTQNKGIQILESDILKVQINTIDFNSNSKIEYRYKLNENDEFIEIGNVKVIKLSNLKAGDYQLKINSTNSSGTWSDDFITLEIIVSEKLIYRPWFIFLCISILLMGAILFNRIRNINLEKRANLLEEAIRQRTDEISRQNKDILQKNKELYRQRKELIELKDSLEDRVQNRTKDLEKKNKDLKYKNEQLEQFSYISSHNLKGPLASMKGLMNLLKVTDDNNEEEILDKLNLSIEKLDSIVTDLSKIIDLREDNRQFDLLSIKEVLGTVISDLDQEIRESDFEIQIADFNDYKIKGVKAYLYSVFYNIIHNSFKYRKCDIDKSFLKVEVSEVDGFVIINFEDNGIGIDMNHAKKKLFRLFQRFNDNLKGKGIGLYMIKTQVEAMKGEILLDSELDKGTTIIIKFPISNLG